jgi:hypothetical protein
MENGVYDILGRAALAKRLQIEHKIDTITDDTCALCFRHCRNSAHEDFNRRRLSARPTALICTAEIKEDNKVH